MSERASALYRGTVEHRRFGPKPHRFRYSVFHLYVDLDELDEVFRPRWLWSVERRNVASFRRRDYFGDPEMINRAQNLVRDELQALLPQLERYRRAADPSTGASTSPIAATGTAGTAGCGCPSMLRSRRTS